MNFLFFQQHIFVSHLSLYYCQLHIFLTLLHHKKTLKEDESAVIAFDIGFTFMKIMNFALRTEDDDYEKLDYAKVDVSMFFYDEEALI